MPPSHGTFGWYELMTTDTDAAKTFYTSLTGWNTNEMGSPESAYTVFLVGSAGVAGMMKLPPEAGPMPAWMGYILVDDVDGYADKIVAAGGQLHKGPVDVPGMLRFAVMMDPQGAPFLIFKPLPGMNEAPQTPAPGTPGTIGWHELYTSDMEAAWDFYSSLFGWTKGDIMDMGQMGIYQIFNIVGIPSGGFMNRPPNVPASFWNYYIQVEAADAAAKKITDGGGQIFHGPASVPGGSWIIQGMDPQGAMFALVSTTK